MLFPIQFRTSTFCLLVYLFHVTREYVWDLDALLSHLTHIILSSLRKHSPHLFVLWIWRTRIMTSVSFPGENMYDISIAWEKSIILLIGLTTQSLHSFNETNSKDYIGNQSEQCMFFWLIYFQIGNRDKICSFLNKNQ